MAYQINDVIAGRVHGSYGTKAQAERALTYLSHEPGEDRYTVTSVKTAKVEEKADEEEGE